MFLTSGQENSLQYKWYGYRKLNISDCGWFSLKEYQKIKKEYEDHKRQKQQQDLMGFT